MIFLLIAAFAVMIPIEVQDLVRNKYRRELVVYSILMCIALTISVLYTLNVKVPNPVKDIQYFFRDVLHLTWK